jgi:hypothetical protein
MTGLKIHINLLFMGFFKRQLKLICAFSFDTDMEGSTLSVWVAHGEGKAFFPEERYAEI